MPTNPGQRRVPDAQRVVFMRPAAGAPRRAFRWWMVLVPLFLLFVIWVGRGIEPAMSFDAAAKVCGVSNREKLAQLATLGVLICAGLAVLRVWFGRRGRG
ncbi:MAG: hypothetical protein JXQ75_04580 [Phycisphaerae bacterium]|nr:hypothetical protein [Phycisphaerae bacterium]